MEPVTSESEAVAAAVRVARRLGVSASDPRVLASGYSVRVISRQEMATARPRSAC